MSHIHKTSNYDQFHFFEDHNRKISPRKVQRIKESFQRRFMLQNHSIHVDKDMYIIDGQHRFEAARQLNLPIYYTIDIKGSVNDISDLNSAASLWISKEFTDYYSSLGKKPYIFLKNIVEKYKFPSYFSIMLCSSNENVHLSRSTITKFYKEGKLTLRDTEQNLYDQAEKINEIICTIKDMNMKIKMNNKFFQAALRLIRTEGYDHDVFIKKIPRLACHVIKASKYGNVYDIYHILKEDIYNNKLGEASRI